MFKNITSKQPALIFKISLVLFLFIFTFNFSFADEPDYLEGEYEVSNVSMVPTELDGVRIGMTITQLKELRTQLRRADYENKAFEYFENINFSKDFFAQVTYRFGPKLTPLVQDDSLKLSLVTLKLEIPPEQKGEFLKRIHSRWLEPDKTIKRRVKSEPGLVNVGEFWCKKKDCAYLEYPSLVSTEAVVISWFIYDKNIDILKKVLNLRKDDIVRIERQKKAKRSK